MVFGGGGEVQEMYAQNNEVALTWNAFEPQWKQIIPLKEFSDLFQWSSISEEG